jgi:ribosomal-protein-alanine N-acetyltransferase
MDLASARLTFDILSPADFPMYGTLAMNEEVMKYITGRALNPVEAELRFQAALDATHAYPGAGYFLVKSRFEGAFIGIVKLVQFEKGQAEVGYMLLPYHWGENYASEMLETMIHLARQRKLDDELIGIVDPENPASIRVLTKSGFQLYETGLIDGLPSAYYRLNLSDGPG